MITRRKFFQVCATGFATAALVTHLARLPEAIVVLTPQRVSYGMEDVHAEQQAKIDVMTQIYLDKGYRVEVDRTMANYWWSANA